MTIRLVAFSHDQDLFSRGSEAVERQTLYCRRLHLRQQILVRSKEPRPGVRHHGGLEVLPCPARHWSWYPATAVAVALPRIRGRCHLVSAQDAFLSALPALVAASWWNRPLIIGVFSDEIDNPEMERERPFYRVFNRLAKWLLSRAAAIRTDSAEMAAKLRRLGFGNVHFVPFLIPGQEAFLSVSRSPRQDAMRLLVIARLERQKNVALALEAAAALARRHPVRLTVVGDGSERGQLEERARQPDLAGLVEFRGALPYADLPRCLAGADALLLTSNHETAARVLVLAGLAGVPAVTTATTGAAEVVEDGRSGYIVPLGDLAGLVERLGGLAEDRGRCGRMGEAARARTVAGFGRARVLAGLAALYRSVA